ncbi:hypothetical protein D1614_16055 [Maribellus luteus]|uniref:Uncharacterized protein n=1 Tax=Maribellus luteus TaxID=2305463 RepID=A0A399SXS1_9BACT|nr:hypothetical protein D1614_16055 [Maribellus luteus]
MDTGLKHRTKLRVFGKLFSERRLLLLASGIFFALYGLLLTYCIPYHLWHSEQTQLFSFNADYLAGFLGRPGKPLEYAGSFLVQFFYYPRFGALLLTAVGVLLFILIRSNLKKLNVHGLFWSFLPVLGLLMLQTNLHYSPVYSFHLIVVLLGFRLYLEVENKWWRLAGFAFGWPLLFWLAGAYAFVFLILCLLVTLNEVRKLSDILLPLGYCLLGFAWLAVGYWGVFQLPRDVFLGYPFIQMDQSLYRWGLVNLLYLPALLIVAWLFPLQIRKAWSGWNFKTIGLTVVLLSVGFWGVYDYGLNKKQELILKMDYYVQHEQWEKVLELGKSYPGVNQLVIYYSNLALAKQGLLTEKLFEYPQIGSKGLRLRWERNRLASLLGGEVFYQLHYYNEAFRWAFESSVSHGLNPRAVKRMAQTSLANGHLELAKKYVLLLEETLFYKDWAFRFREQMEQAASAPELKTVNHPFQVHTDFTSDIRGFDLKVEELLQNCPENQAAFDYYTASLLLDKKLEELTDLVLNNPDRFAGPLHGPLAEAVLLYQKLSGKPLDEIQVEPAVYHRFEEFARALSRNRGSQAAYQLEAAFGTTFWYYFYFY